MEEASTFLSSRGYTIFKSCLVGNDLRSLRDELTVRPYIPKSPVQPPSFSIYQESLDKIHIPRFFGEENYGKAHMYCIPEGEKIAVKFRGELRDYQTNVVNTYMKNLSKKEGGGGLLEIPCGRGKCHAPGTPIMMSNGKIKMIETINKGEQVMGDDSKPRTVISVGSGIEDMWRIRHSDGTSYVVNYSHILALAYVDDGTIYKTEMSLADYINMLRIEPHRAKKYYGYRVPVAFESRVTPNDPYTFGLLFGKVENRIPDSYKINSRRVRLNVLAGIIDSKGESIKNIGYKIYQRNNTQLSDIEFICYTLGIRLKKLHIRSDGLIPLILEGESVNDIPVRKVKRIIVSYNPYNLLQKLDITFEGVGLYYGIEIDGNHKYLLGDCIVTHNTVIALNIITHIARKTLVIVHKSFLMSQWIERIRQFIPNARIGKIQGQVIDIDDKDIVIGMLQSLSMKEYPEELFASFGLTIVDECHHISSEVFSRSLLKIVTPYCLGLSATMQRKDGLTKVFKMFLGNIIYSEKRDADDTVLVRGIRYEVNDDEFNSTVYDYRGNPQYSTMLTKLCTYSHRTEFILNVLVQELNEKAEQQILVLGHYKNLLIYLHDAIASRNIASVGYYIGGMKEADLKNSETKKIIIATYAMAAEALDIKSLTTLVLATPKTDVVQAVGRILRVKHERPLIVDIIDSHEVFNRQWQKRLHYYKKNKYQIATIRSKDYNKGEWEILDSLTKKRKKPVTNSSTGLPIGQCVINVS